MPQAKMPADDLFQQSSMSFGDHLEALRKALGKALVWLGLGMLVGLYFAEDIILFVEKPLKGAITEFHIKRAKEEFLQANGVDPGPELASWMAKHALVPQRVFLDPASVTDPDSGVLGNPFAGLIVEEEGSEEEDSKEGSKPLQSASKQVPQDDKNQVEPQDVEAPKVKSGTDEAGGADDTDKEPQQASAAAKADLSQKETASNPAESEVTESNPAESEVTKVEPKKSEPKNPEAKKSEPATLVAEAEPDSSTKSEAGDESPWLGIDLKRLGRLRPVLIWRPVHTNLVSLESTEGFMVWLKAGLAAGIVIASPGIFWHIWQFFAAGLYPHERRYVYWYLPLSLVLFLGGVFLAFFVVFELVLGFLMQYTVNMDVDFTPRLTDYMSFALFLPLGFGIAFQLPIVMLGLHRFGVISVDLFISQWRIAVLVIAFLSMMLSPPEIYSMMGLFIPLVFLYFFGIFLCKYMPKGAGVGGDALDPQG